MCSSGPGRDTGISAVIAFTLFIGIHAAPIERRVSYTGHRVLRVLPTSLQQIHYLFELTAKPHCDLEIWGDPRVNHTVDIRVGPYSFQDVTYLLMSCRLHYDIEIHDLQKLIDEEIEHTAQYHRRKRSATRPRSSNYFYWFTVVGRYATYSEIKDWLYYANYAKPEITKVIDLGYSYESRPMKVLKIGKPSSYVKPAIWIDGGIHAREWISPAVVCYIINVLIDGYGSNDNITQLVDTYDWYLLPVANPDGYQYTHNVDRLWRKTRSRPNVWGQRRCNGVDLNRNFDYHWMGHCDFSSPVPCRGVSPCDTSYAGVTPFSEREARNIAEFLYRRRGNIKLYLSLHSYSQMWLTPWGYTQHAPKDINKLMSMSRKAVSAMQKTFGTTYLYGSPAQLLYTAGGGSFDWAKGSAGIDHAYAVELRDRGRFGFLLPASQITPTGQEVWQGIQAVAYELIKEGKKQTQQQKARFRDRRRRRRRRRQHPENSV